MTEVYLIRERQTGCWFAGHDYNGEVDWSEDQQHAVKYCSRLHAETQALLLAQDDEWVQRKAVKCTDNKGMIIPCERCGGWGVDDLGFKCGKCNGKGEGE